MIRRPVAVLALALLCACSAVSAQLTIFYDTPAVAGSTSVDLNGGLGVNPDGTVHGAAGGAMTRTNSISNPILNALTGGAYKNRPKAASAAYTQIPLALQQTKFPTLSYGLAEGKGDLLSTSDGIWGNAEFGYNPLNNNLAASASTGTAHSANTGGSDRIGEAGPDRGASGIEYAGYSNQIATLADARTDQSAQAIAYPSNVLNPASTLTCTQALLYAATITQYDLGTPVTPLPREGGTSVIPFCLTLFNFATLDDFSTFVNNGTFNNTLPVPPGNSTGIAAGTDNNGTVFVSPEGFAQPLPGSNATEEERSAARSSSAVAPREPATVGATISDAIENAPDALQQLAATPLFQALVERASSGVFAEAVDGFNKLTAKQADKTVQTLAAPLANLNQAIGKLTKSVAGGVTNAGLKSFAAAVETAQPLLAATAAVNNAVSPVARASKAAAEKLAAESQKKLAETEGAVGVVAEPQQKPAAAGRRLLARTHL